MVLHRWTGFQTSHGLRAHSFKWKDYNIYNWGVYPEHANGKVFILFDDFPIGWPPSKSGASLFWRSPEMKWPSFARRTDSFGGAVCVTSNSAQRTFPCWSVVNPGFLGIWNLWNMKCRPGFICPRSHLGMLCRQLEDHPEAGRQRHSDSKQVMLLLEGRFLASESFSLANTCWYLLIHCTTVCWYIVLICWLLYN